METSTGFLSDFLSIKRGSMIADLQLTWADQGTGTPSTPRRAWGARLAAFSRSPEVIATKKEQYTYKISTVTNKKRKWCNLICLKRFSSVFLGGGIEERIFHLKQGHLSHYQVSALQVLPGVFSFLNSLYDQCNANHSLRKILCNPSFQRLIDHCVLTILFAECFAIQVFRSSTSSRPA
jgi:hypothetical protein